MYNDRNTSFRYCFDDVHSYKQHLSSGFNSDKTVSWCIFFLQRRTCNIIEVKDPGGCEQTDSTYAETREKPRLPRSPRRLHAASRSHSPAQNMSPLSLCLCFAGSLLYLLTGATQPVALVPWFIAFQLSGLWSPSTTQQDVKKARPVISISAPSTAHSLARHQPAQHPSPHASAARADIQNIEDQSAPIQYEPTHPCYPRSDPGWWIPPSGRGVFSWSHRQDHQGAPSDGWGDWRRDRRLCMDHV